VMILIQCRLAVALSTAIAAIPRSTARSEPSPLVFWRRYTQVDLIVEHTHPAHGAFPVTPRNQQPMNEYNFFSQIAVLKTMILDRNAYSLLNCHCS